MVNDSFYPPQRQNRFGWNPRPSAPFEWRALHWAAWRLPFYCAAAGVTVSLAVLTSPVLTLAAMLAAGWFVLCLSDRRWGLLAIVLTIASPPFLYLDRVQSTYVVDALICGALVLFLLAAENFKLPHPSQPMSRAAYFFATYIGMNFAWAIYSGHDRTYAVNELIPVAEMYACYWLALRVELSGKTMRQLLLLTLMVTAARGAWQIFLVITGAAGSLVPPVFSRAEEAEQVIAGVRITKLIDPLQGLCLPAAFGVWLLSPPGKLRTIALAAAAVTAVVLVLSLERAEWIAAIVCFCFVLYLVSRRAARSLRHAALVVAGVVAALALGLVSLHGGSFDFGEILQTRLIDYTRQQVFDPQNQLQMLRLLEFKTAIDAFFASPVFGKGLGTGLGTTVALGDSTEFVPIHNYYLNLLASTGLIGMGLFLWLVLRVGKTLLVAYRSVENAFDRGFILFTLIGMFWYAIFIAFHPVYSAYHIPALLGIFAGATARAISRNPLNAVGESGDARGNTPSPSPAAGRLLQ